MKTTDPAAQDLYDGSLDVMDCQPDDRATQTSPRIPLGSQLNGLDHLLEPARHRAFIASALTD